MVVAELKNCRGNAPHQTVHYAWPATAGQMRDGLGVDARLIYIHLPHCRPGRRVVVNLTSPAIPGGSISRAADRQSVLRSFHHDRCSLKLCGCRHLSSRRQVMDAAQLMQLAIREARQGIAGGQSPFGCAIARDGELLAATHNSVVLDGDITAHAEVNAVRAACRTASDIFLTGAVVATTCEPCPMCAAALHWARVGKVYYGASIADAAAAGFNELALPASTLLEQGGSTLELTGGLLAEECQRLFVDWLRDPNRMAY